VEALNLIEANHFEGKVFNYYNWGGYIDWRTQGRLQVFIDGRAGTAFDEKTYRQYLAVLACRRAGKTWLGPRKLISFLWPQHSPKQIEQLRKSGHWRVLYSDTWRACWSARNAPRKRRCCPRPTRPGGI